MNHDERPFLEFLRELIGKGTLGADDILNVALPLFEQVRAVHDTGRVAPLAGLSAMRVSGGRCYFPDSASLAPRRNAAAVDRIEKLEARAIEITGHEKREDGADGNLVVTDALLGKHGAEIKQPVFLPGYITWEHEVEHHDPLTDIFSLGMVTASLACGVDLSDDDDLAKFVAARANLFQLNPHLHPVLAKAIVRMTEPRRKRRAQDLPSLILALRHYREQPAAAALDFQSIRGFKEANRTGRRQAIQERLRDRLFEISRRNRLLYFRPAMQSLNLTVGSVPVLLDYKNIAPDSLCTWQGDFEKTISRGDTVPLGRYLRFEDAPYLSGVLDQIRNHEARDRAEYGFSQLRLVLSFLRWHNFKDVKEERITSPLVLLPVKLEKKKGVRDSFTLTPLTTEAEINPVLRHHLRQVYGLQLPEFIDLSQTTLTAFHELLQQQIQASEPGITLRLIAQPRIKLIHERARARLEYHRRRSRLTGRGVRRIDDIDYSYSRENFHPLGLQLLLKRVKPSPSPFQSVLGETPRPRTFNIGAPPPPPPDQNGGTAQGPSGDIREREMFALQEDTETNPYQWDFDLCSLTLGNFNYRKMSLVRDYTTLLDKPLENAAFDSVFSLHPRKAEAKNVAPLPPEESFQIAASDPTQMAAIARARTGESYIIQGPPGTGKSQTITNLIADYAARGKRVLFVCQKRAAIDVVYYRLKQRGLDKLCCLIHDSQEDKKAFIHDLKATYEQYLATPDAQQQATQMREEAIKNLRQELDPPERFTQAMRAIDPQDGLSLRRIYARLVELADALPELNEADAEQLPRYAEWLQRGDAVQRLARVLTDARLEPVFAEHALRLLAPEKITGERPIENITGAIDRTGPILQRIEESFAKTGLAECADTASIAALIAYAENVQILAERSLLPLLDRNNDGNARLREALQRRQAKLDTLQKAREKTAHWRDRIPESDLGSVLDLARSLQGSMLRFLMPSFWRLRKILNSRYDFSKHVVAPTWVRILEDLSAEYAAAAAFDAASAEFKAAYRIDDPEALVRTLALLHAGEAALHPAQRVLRARLLDHSLGAQAVAQLLELKPELQALQHELNALFHSNVLDAGKKTRALTQIKSDLASLRASIPLLSAIVPVLTELLAATPAFYRALCERPWTPQQFEAAILLCALIRAYQRDRSLPRVDGRVLAQHAERVKRYHDESMSLNANVILQRVHADFLRKVQLSSATAAQLTPEQKEWKKLYTKGRRELEHEFGKVMRYRSIRDLSDDETGLVVSDLKPVWLMSPLSVSDTLPLSNTGFDVVIFDEASQIPLEESVPALYRAAQIIVVGDEMQLPPTDFFSSRSEDEEALQIEEHGETIAYDLNSDSFLTQAAANLPSTMLGWHYRSRSESLISFSNAAFYERKLLTIPDVRLPSSAKGIDVANAEAGDANFGVVLDRPVSFHYVANGLYEDRRNAPEAAYIARLLRGVLKRKTGLSVGIVAFSEAQQDEIESALNALAQDDPEFREVLDAEFVREEDDQFVGLFVKNLENVQGDERDIIILSVCYGYDRNRKMLMNFGPINKNGGEKRLNVVFSRARHHMVLVSSIRHTAITNEYNDGANCLRQYLAYADALSSGQFESARRILFASKQLAAAVQSAPAVDSVAKSMADALRQRGYRVDLAVGESYFRCDLAVRKEGDSAYRLAVLIDSDVTRGIGGELETAVLQPAILKSFGWRVVRAFAKDWHHDSKQVLEQFERLLSQE